MEGRGHEQSEAKNPELKYGLQIAEDKCTLTWKNDASTPRKQRVLKVKPIMLTDITGSSLIATLRSIVGISILGERKAVTCNNTTAMRSWIRRNKSGRSGELFKTALFLFNRQPTGNRVS